MANIFEIDDSLRRVMQNAQDDLIDQLGKDCRLHYPPIMMQCNNCILDPIGRKSSNRYLHGGPIPFQNGSICPSCGGAGMKAREQTEIVNLLIQWKPKEFKPVGVDDLRIPDGTLRAKGYITDMPKVMKCSYMVPHIDIEAYARYRFRLSGDPYSPQNIVQGRYFVSYWVRV